MAHIRYDDGVTESVGIRALQRNASAVVARAEAGEVIEVTDHGRPVARIVPLRHDRLVSLVESGMARPARIAAADLPAPLPATSGAASLSDLLAQARDDER